jgi:hypothetical protein
MGIVNWNDAPEGAEFYSSGNFYKTKCGLHWFSSVSATWVKSINRISELFAVEDYEPRPAAQQWPETEERINNIGRNRTLDDMGHYNEQREAEEREKVAREIEARERKKQTQSAAPLTNKYDRTIIGKYATGKCVVDVYRVLNAFPTGSPEIDHALKKLLAAGKRGAKDELQDLREAVQSIEARIDYLVELDA